MKLGKSKIFLILCLCFVVGVFLGNYVINYVMYYIVASLAVIFIASITIFWRQKQVMLIGFGGLLLLLGLWRYHQVVPDQNDPGFVGQFFYQKVELEGVVVREPDVRSDKVNLTVGRAEIRPLPSPPQAWGGKLEGNILLNLGRYPEYQYGDLLKISGKLEEPFESEEFSYKDYLARFDTYAYMRFPEIEKVAQNRGNSVKASLLAVKHKFQNILSQSLPEPHNGLAQGLILGVKRALPEDFREALVAVGVSHIVVISGYNISIITRNILKMRWAVGRKIAFGFSFLVVLAFVVMTGADASVVRASAMGLTLVLAMNIGRLYSPVNALVLVGTAMVAQNPKILNFDIGFQLSFLATLGLIYLAPIFEKWFQKIPNVLGFRDNLASSCAAILATLPLLIFYFDRISLIALPANVLVLWVIPYTMFLAFILGVMGMIWLPLGKVIASLAWVLLEYLIRVVEIFAKFPLASTTARINIPVIVIYYLLLVYFLWLYRKRKKFYHQLEYAVPRL